MEVHFSLDGMSVVSVTSVAGTMTLWHALDGSITKVKEWGSGVESKMHIWKLAFTPDKGHLIFNRDSWLILQDTRHPFNVIAETRLGANLRAIFEPKEDSEYGFKASTDTPVLQDMYSYCP